MINLIIKGNMFDASNASHARGIALVSAAQLFDNRPSEVVASVADAALDAVRQWYLETDGPAPYPAGALLFYSTREDREHTADAMFASEARETVERDEPSSNLRVSTSCYGGWR